MHAGSGSNPSRTGIRLLPASSPSAVLLLALAAFFLLSLGGTIGVAPARAAQPLVAAGASSVKSGARPETTTVDGMSHSTLIYAGLTLAAMLLMAATYVLPRRWPTGSEVAPARTPHSGDEAAGRGEEERPS